MVKKCFVFLFLAVCIISFASALNTEIKVKTVPGYEVQLTAAQSTTYFTAIEGATTKIIADEYGDVSVNFSIVDAKYNLYCYIKNDGETVLTDVLTELVTGETQNLELLPSWAKPLYRPEIENLSANFSEENGSTIEENLENEVSDNQSEKNLVERNESEGNWISSTGLVIFDKVKKAFSNKVFYYVLGVVVLMGVFIVARRRFTRTSRRSDFNIGGSGRNEEIRDAERRLREAQAEIKRLRNSDRINELEDELRRLKGD